MARIDTSGAYGRDGADGRPGRRGKDGRRLKKGGRSRGGNGTAGTAGKKGTKGKKGKNVRGTLSMSPRGLQYKGTGGTVDLCGGLTIDASGGRGGHGGDGGRGGSGGYGDPSGDRGRDGSGGDGADGGDGGNVTLTTADSHLFGLVERINVAGGSGGRGGSGSPRGTSGYDGADGEVLLVHKNKKLGLVEEDDHFGLRVGQLARGFDDSFLDGNATRGTVFTIAGAHVANRCAISIPAPFAVRIGGAAPLQVATDLLMVDDGLLEPYDHRVAEGEVRGSVAERCDIGYFSLVSSAWSARDGTPIPLGSCEVDPSYVVPVNHRLDLADALAAWGSEGTIAPTEEELEPDDDGLIPYEPALRQARLALTPVDEDRVFMALLKAELDRLDPDDQMAAYSALLLSYFLNADELEIGKLDARLDEMAAILEGRLTSRERFLERFNTYAAQPQTRQRVGAGLAATSHFFGSLNRDTRGKILDAAWFGASTDGYLDPNEKRMLLALSAVLGFDCAWVDEHMPQLRRPGVSTATAEQSNRLAIALVPIASAALLAAALAVVHTEIAGILELGWTTPPGAVSLAALAALAFALGSKLVEGMAFNLACRSCASVRLAPLDASKGKLMIGDADAYRCLDCGARGTREPGSDRRLFHPERSLAEGGNAGAVVATMLLVGLAVALQMTQAGLGVTDPAVLVHGGLYVLAFWLLWPFERVHEISVVWLALMGVAWLAIFFFANGGAV